MSLSRQVLMIEPDELSRLFKEMENSIVERLRPQMQVIEQPISHKEAAAYLGITPDTLTRHLKAGIIPSNIVHVKGKRKAYFKSELRKLL